VVPHFGGDADIYPFAVLNDPIAGISDKKQPCLL